MDAAGPAYSHTQKAPLCLILYGSGLACLALAWSVRDTPGVYIPGAVSLLFALLAPAFQYLTVEDQGDRLAIRFGPLPLCRRTVQYADIDSVEVGRTLLPDGWGIHYTIRGGWLWNLWGRDCVVVRSTTVECCGSAPTTPKNLAGFLEARIAG